VGAGVHWKAQPMFHPGLLTEKTGLVQLPCIWVGPSSSRAGSTAVEDVVVDVSPPAPVVVVLEPEAEVVVVTAAAAPPVEVVVEALDPLGGGSV
jgi:hypothetical protein